MDPDSPVSRVGRTFWTVWSYITEAVNRFLRPEPTNTDSNDPNASQQSAVDSEPADSDHPEGDTSGRGDDEEQLLEKASLLSLSRPVVAWDLCTTDIDLGPVEESMQYKSQLSGGNESTASEEGEGTREEQLGQTRNDDAGLPVTKDARAKEDEEEENRDWKLYTHGQGEMPENDEYEEQAKMESRNLTEDAMSEDTEGNGRKDAEDETQGALDDHQKMDETMTEIQVKEEDDKIHHADEKDLEAEDTDFSLEEELSMPIEEARVERDEVVTALMYEEVENSLGVLQLASENQNKYDEEAKPVENQFSVAEELSESDVEGDKGITSLEDELQTTLKKSGSVSEDVGQEHAMAHRSESDEVEDEREKEDESTVDEREQSEEETVNDAADNQAIDEEPEQEEDVKTGSEDIQGIFIEHVTYNEEAVQNAEAELDTAEFTDEEKEDVAKDTEVQTKTREMDDVDGAVTDEKSHVTATDISADERVCDEEERLSSETEDDTESCMEIACTSTSFTVKPEGETGKEKSGESKNIPPGICEGSFVVSQGLNSPTSEETQEGVPEYNNDPGPDENTTQSFLDVGDSKEIHAAELPEEVESKELESLKNSGAGGDYLMLREQMKEERENTEDIEKEHTGILHLTDTGLPQETEELLVEPATEESGHLFEEEEGKLLDSSKMGMEHSEKHFETHVGVTGETTKELQDVTEELLVEFEKDEGLSAEDGCETTGAIAAEDSVVGFADETLKMLEAEVQNMTRTAFFQEEEDTINFEQNSNMTPSLLEDIVECGFMKEPVETEPKLLEDRTVEMQDAGIDTEEPGYGVEEEEVEDEIQSNNEMEFFSPEVVGMAAGPATEKNTDNLFGESEISRTDESLETKDQLSDEAFGMSKREMLTDTEAVGELMTIESRPKDLTLIAITEMAKHVTESEGSYPEETSSSVSQDVIDQEILDLWIQTASLKDTNDMEQQEGPEPGQQMDTKIEPSNEEQDEMPSVQAEKEKEKLVESNSGESGLLSDAEMSSSTAESGFSDQSVSEWDTNQSDTHLLKSTSTGSFQGIYDKLASMSESADISELSTQQPNSESQHILMEEAVEAGQSDLTEKESSAETGFPSDSGVISSEAGHLNQESDESQEKTDEEQVESAMTETGSQEETDAEVVDRSWRTDWKDTEEADVEAKMGSLFKDEKTKVEDAPLEVTESDSPDEIKHAESGRSRSGSDASSQDEIMLTESQDDACTESKKLLKLPSLDKPQPGWSEDIAESLLELNRAEDTEQTTTKPEDQTEVDVSSLDFSAQRSRIAVKNPHVRPPKDPRSLLNMPSLDPTPSSHLPVRAPIGVPLGGMGIGIKLPGLGAGFPVLKKTRVVREDKSSESSQEPESKSEEKSDTPKQDEAQHRPKWMPPRQPGFGNPLMSELKSKLKKTTKE
ncbi:claspin [Seriola aureovittata]|uniref:claspin n=1 Tax=Seriola aureovittata TaxID=2871759 RepID=UPI0024BDC2F0|nr:claspin [Seriola aureovittata]